MLRITRRVDPDGRPRLELAGRLTAAELPILEQAVRLGGSGGGSILLDVAGLTYADPAGAAALAARCRAGDHLCSPSGLLRRLLGETAP